MATDITLILSTVFFTSILLHLPSMTMSDEPCPYPCYSPPTGTGPVTVIGMTPPPPPYETGSYSPPGNYPTPTGNFPYNPSPNSGNNYYGPPPPDPILPYFPYYYRKPPHKTDASSEAGNVPKSRIMIATVTTFVFGFTLIF